MKHNIYTPEFFAALINQGKTHPEPIEEANNAAAEKVAGPSMWKVLFDLLQPSPDISR